MPMPKSVTRVTKDGVKFTSNVDRAQYTIKELTRAALRDVSKLVKNKMKAKIPVFTGNLKSNVGSWVRRLKNGDIVLQVGIYNIKTSRKKGKTPAYHAHLLEFGTVKMRAQPFLRPSTFENIEEIKTITGKYLSSIENENTLMGLMNETEEVE